MKAAFVQCALHGDAFHTFVYHHLADDPAQLWFSTPPGPEEEWPESWCSICNVAYLREKQWNDKDEGELDIQLLCHHCFRTHRALGTGILVSEPGCSWHLLACGPVVGTKLKHYPFLATLE